MSDPRRARPAVARTGATHTAADPARYADGDVPAAVRTEIDRLTVRVERDRRWVADSPRRRIPPVVALPPLAAAGIAAVASLRPDLVVLGLLILLVTAVLGFVPARRLGRRRRLRRRERQWAGHQIPRESVSARWRPALDVLADSERWLRLAKLPEQAIAAEELGRALERARAGTRMEPNIARVDRQLRGAAGSDAARSDVDVQALQADLVRAVEVRNALLAANEAAAHVIADLTQTTRTELAGQAVAVEAVREPALGTLADSIRDAAELLPDPPDPAVLPGERADPRR